MRASSPDELRRLAKNRETERLVLVANVGKNPDNTTYLATPYRSGSHWVLVTVELTDRPTVRSRYCDSMGWAAPPDLTCHAAAGYLHPSLWDTSSAGDNITYDAHQQPTGTTINAPQTC